MSSVECSGQKCQQVLKWQHGHKKLYTQCATQILNAKDAQNVQNLNNGAQGAFDQLARILVQLPS